MRAYVTSAHHVKATRPIIALLTAGIINPVCVSPVIILSVNGEGDPREYFITRARTETAPEKFWQYSLRCLTTMKLCA